MGYRIELEDIENAINSITFVKESAVIYKRLNESYGKIIAYLVTQDKLDENLIKSQLQLTLPQYMIPNKIEFLTELPKNANGKIDWKKLKESQWSI